MGTASNLRKRGTRRLGRCLDDSGTDQVAQDDTVKVGQDETKDA